MIVGLVSCFWYHSYIRSAALSGTTRSYIHVLFMDASRLRILAPFRVLRAQITFYKWRSFSKSDGCFAEGSFAGYRRDYDIRRMLMKFDAFCERFLKIIGWRRKLVLFRLAGFLLFFSLFLASVFSSRESDWLYRNIFAQPSTLRYITVGEREDVWDTFSISVFSEKIIPSTNM